MAELIELNEPTRQAEQKLYPALLKNPAGHEIQSSCPLKLYFPATQSKHDVAFERLAYLPPRQFVQVDDPAKLAYLPGLQSEQLAEPLILAVPTLHKSQEALPTVPAYLPAEQSVQDDAPNRENFPVVQSEQAVDAKIDE